MNFSFNNSLCRLIKLIKNTLLPFLEFAFISVYRECLIINDIIE